MKYHDESVQLNSPNSQFLQRSYCIRFDLTVVISTCASRRCVTRSTPRRKTSLVNNQQIDLGCQNGGFEIALRPSQITPRPDCASEHESTSVVGVVVNISSFRAATL